MILFLNTFLEHKYLILSYIIINKYDSLKILNFFFFLMYLVLKFLDLLLSEILSPSMDPQAFWRRFHGQQYGQYNNNSLSQCIGPQEFLQYDKYLLYSYCFCSYRSFLRTSYYLGSRSSIPLVLPICFLKLV